MPTEQTCALNKLTTNLRKKAEKHSDKRTAGDDPSFASYTMDLQSLLYTPCSSVSSLYYARKLCVYNFTVQRRRLLYLEGM